MRISGDAILREGLMLDEREHHDPTPTHRSDRAAASFERRVQRAMRRRLAEATGSERTAEPKPVPSPAGAFSAHAALHGLDANALIEELREECPGPVSTRRRRPRTGAAETLREALPDLDEIAREAAIETAQSARRRSL